VYSVRLTEELPDWLVALRDPRAQLRITARLRTVEAGSLGDWKTVGRTVSEVRIDVGAG